MVENDSSRDKRDEHWRFLLPIVLHQVVMGSTRMMFPVLYLEFAHYFGKRVGAAGWIGSIQAGATYLFAVLISGPLKTYGCRKVAITGHFIIGLSLAASYLAPNVIVLCVTYGLIAGLGMSMANLSGEILIQQRFHKNRSLATAVAMLGLGVGNGLSPLWADLLIQSYGWRGALLVQAGVALNGCVVAMFMWTPKVYRYRPKPTEESAGCLRTYIRDVGDFSSLKDPRFLLFCISQTLAKFSMFAATRHLANKGLVDGFSMTQAALLVTIHFAGLFLARVPSGLLADRKWINRTVLVALVLMVSGVILGCMALPDQYIVYCVLSAAFGVTVGCTNLIEKIILVDLLGVERISRTRAITCLFEGMAVLTGIPFTGWVYDVTNNYDIPFITNGGIRVLSGAITLSIFFIKKDRKYSHSSQEWETSEERRKGSQKCDTSCKDTNQNEESTM